jgi:hypothetical protein
MKEINVHSKPTIKVMLCLIVQTTTSAFHPKALIKMDLAAGLLAFHIAGAFPSVR